MIKAISISRLVFFLKSVYYIMHFSKYSPNGFLASEYMSQQFFTGKRVHRCAILITMGREGLNKNSYFYLLAD